MKQNRMVIILLTLVVAFLVACGPESTGPDTGGRPTATSTPRPVVPGANTATPVRGATNAPAPVGNTATPVRGATTAPAGAATVRPGTTAQPTGSGQVGGKCPQGCTAEFPGCAIKGNINSSGEKLYHIVGNASYNETIIDPAKGEKWFCTEDEAVANGWKKAGN